MLLDEGPYGRASSAVVERTTVRTELPYRGLVEAFEREVARWDPAVAQRLVQGRAPWREVAREVAQTAGPRGLLIIFEADQGAIASLAGSHREYCLYLVGNPALASEILAIDPRASLYVPFRVCLYGNGLAR